MRILFLGSGAFGIPTLDALRSHHELVGIVSQPARPAGRRRTATATPVAAYAASLDCPLRCTENANIDETAAWVASLNPDATVVVAFGQKLLPDLLSVLGPVVMNLHASLLPKFRGAAPINRALMCGEKQTGVSVISIAERMDAGLVYAQKSTAIGEEETAGELHDRLAALGAPVVEAVLAAAATGSLHGAVQDESQVTQAPKLTKADGTVCFDATPDAVRCRVHGLTPWPSARVTWRRRKSGQPVPLTLLRVAVSDQPIGNATAGTVLQGHHVAVRNGAIRLLEVQLPGKRPMRIDDFVRGNPMPAGDSLA